LLFIDFLWMSWMRLISRWFSWFFLWRCIKWRLLNSWWEISCILFIWRWFYFLLFFFIFFSLKPYLTLYHSKIFYRRRFCFLLFSFIFFSLKCYLTLYHSKSFICRIKWTLLPTSIILFPFLMFLFLLDTNYCRRAQTF